MLKELIAKATEESKRNRRNNHDLPGGELSFTHENTLKDFLFNRAKAIAELIEAARELTERDTNYGELTITRAMLFDASAIRIRKALEGLE